MKTRLLIFILFMCAHIVKAQQINVNGAHIVSTPNNYWVIKNGDFTLVAHQANIPATFENLKIDSDASLRVDQTSFMTINGTIINSSGADGLVLESGIAGSASLLHNTSSVDATVERYLTGNPILQSKHYHQVCFPLTQPVPATHFFGSYLWEWSPVQQEFVSLGPSGETPVSNQKGYLVFYPDNSVTFDFAGQLNNASISLPLAQKTNDFTLVPNPYPSAINWDEGAGWTRNNLEGSYWIWSPTANNYAVYNGIIGSLGATGFIPSGQSFFVKNTAASPMLTINNNARSHSYQDYFKNSKEQLDYIKVSVSANENRDELLVLFHDQAEHGIDPLDSKKLFGSPESPQLFSISDAVELTINCIPVSENNFYIPLGFKISSDTQIELIFDMQGPLFQTAKVFLEDVLINEMVDLSQYSSYSFQHELINNPNRFKLHFRPMADLEQPSADAFRYWSFDGRVFLSIPEIIDSNANIQMFDVVGNLLLNNDYIFSNPTVVHTKYRGVVILKVSDKESIRVGKLLIQ